MEPQTVSTIGINKTLLLVASISTHFFNPFMGAAVNIALKKIGTDFSMSAIGLSWVSMSYLLASVVFMVPFGRLGDMWGRTRLFLCGTIFFAITTFSCAFVGNATMLIVVRFLQGIGAAMMSSTLMAIVVSAFPPDERGKVIGLNVSAVYIGSSLAPLIGGFIVDALNWRSLFFINATASTLIAALIILKLNREWSETARGKFDFKGSLLYMASISMLMVGCSKLPLWHAVMLTVAGFTGLFVFAKVELKTESPILDIRLFTQNRVFALSNLSALINYAATFSISFMLSLYLQYAKGMQAREAGMVLMAQPILMAIVASFSGRLSDRKSPRMLAAMGMGISAVGLLVLSFIGEATSTGFIVFGLIILGIGFGLFSSPNTNVVMGAVDKKVYGTASALLGTMRSTGMMFSMAIASLTIHWFMGNAQINESTIPQLIASTKIVFVVFTILCSVGVYTSLSNNRGVV
jgi:EmrB/QacA subfamily drug resistance transporter